jgi:hypothetical protein
MSQNEAILIELGSPLLLVPVANIIQILENAAVAFGVHWRIKKASFQCIRRYLDLTKRSNTHRDRLPLLLVPAANILQILENATATFGVHWRIEKASIQCISTHIDLTKRSNTDRDRSTPPAGTCSKTPCFLAISFLPVAF